MSYKFIESAAKGRLKKASFSMFEQIIPYTSLNNFAFLHSANDLLKLMQIINSNPKEYVLEVENTAIDVYVIVIGESLRTDHLSLYGYARKTTPYLESIQDHKPSKQSVEVPMFIWYSNEVPNSDKKLGRYDLPYPTADNYELIANWLGIEKIDGMQITSPLKADFVPPDKPILIMDSELTIFNYQDLKSDEQIKR